MKFNVVLDEGSKMPTKAHDGDAGYDLYSPVSITLYPGSSVTINTGVHMLIRSGYVGFIKSRSGLNTKYGISCEGVIDAGYTGSIVVKLFNHGKIPYMIAKGEKISQIVILPTPRVKLNEVKIFRKYTDRGSNGFGSTGKM